MVTESAQVSHTSSSCPAESAFPSCDVSPGLLLSPGFRRENVSASPRRVSHKGPVHGLRPLSRGPQAPGFPQLLNRLVENMKTAA